MTKKKKIIEKMVLIVLAIILIRFFIGNCIIYGSYNMNRTTQENSEWYLKNHR